jgi:imidazole glycerol-phosphate synthase subunit HisH
VIAIVDYGSGNIKAIANIYHRLSIPAFVASTPGDLERATRIILPGVGAFDQAMQHLDDSGLRAALNKRVLEDRVPFLGICVGMQLLARRSDEGKLPGLGWIDADVRRFDDSQFHQRTHLPHMGWNDVEGTRGHPLLAGLAEAGDTSFYFLHSYYIACDRKEDILAETEYGGRFHAAVQSRNIHGVQFHPEKSHQNGVRMLKNFAEL